MASCAQQGHVYGPSAVDGNAHVQNGDYFVNQIEQHHTTVTYFPHSLHAHRYVPPPPSIVTPYRRNRDFVVRDEYTTLWHRRHERGSRIALVGLGGVGKSHLNIEFAFRLHEEQPNVWVFWVHASSLARFEDSYKKIAESLQIPGRHEPQADICSLVQVWLSRPDLGSWVMVVDNADDERVVLGRERAGSSKKDASTSLSLSHYLPCSVHGLTVVTTRNRSVAQGLIGYDEDIISLGPMDKATATELLEKKLDGSIATYTRDDLITLAQQVDYMPLAMTQAAAYIRQRAPRMSVTRYIRQLQEGDEQCGKLLQGAVHDPWRDSEASNSIILTWHQSFTYICKEHDSASRLLSLMSLFDREGIPEDLLPGQYPARDRGVKYEGATFEDDVAVLRDFDLINLNATPNTFDMHRIVQLATRKWLEVTHEIDWWQQRYIEILGTHFPTGHYVDWPRCQALLPHVVLMKVTESTQPSVRKTYAAVLFRAAWYTNLRGQYNQAEVMARRSYEIRVRLVGAMDTVALVSISQIGAILQDQGKYCEAEVMHQRALAGYKQKLGKDHPYTFTSVSQVGSVLLDQGKYGEAEVMLRQSLAGYEQKLGKNHPDTLTSVSQVGRVLQKQGQYGEAEVMFRRALAGYEQKLGKDHPYTFTSVSQVGSVLRDQGKYGEAEVMLRRVLAGYEQKLGDDHPYTLTSVSQVGSVLQRQGKYDEVEVMFRRALAGYEQKLGRDHPYTFTSVSQLGSVLQSQGKYGEAEVMHRRALAGREQQLGEQHPDTLASVSHLGSVLQKQGKYGEAEVMFRRDLAGAEKVLGENHPETLTSVSHLGSVLQSQGKYGEAEVMHRRALAGREQQLGEQHPDTLKSVSHVGIVLQDQGKYGEAEVMHRRSLAGREQQLGEQHPDTLTSVSQLGSVLQSQGKCGEAEVKHRRALAGREQQLGEQHPDTLASVSHLGSVLQSQGKYGEAEMIQRRALAGYERKLGKDHSHTLTSVWHLATLLTATCVWDEAIMHHYRALSGLEAQLGYHHPNTAICRQQFIDLEEWVARMAP